MYNQPIIVNGSIVVPRVDESNYLFLNRLTILYGESGTGKTMLISHILHSLREKIPIAIVANPTNKLNKSYDSIFPSQAIHDDMTKDLLIRIFKRQTQALAMHNLIKNISILEPIFKKIASPNEHQKIQKLIHMIQQTTRKIDEEYNEIDAEHMIAKVQEIHNDKLVQIMKKAIHRSQQSLLNEHVLTEEQQMIVKNINFNPNILLLLDDCASSVKEWKDLKEMKQLFFEGRHYHATVIIAMQNESILPPPLRNNAHINIFTTEAVVNTYFRKDSCGISSSQRKKIYEIARMIFEDSGDKKNPNYKKLCFFGPVIKVDKRIQYIIAQPRKFQFGSNMYWELCNRIKRDELCDMNTNVLSKLFS
jgi:hypothetical protein